MKYLSLFSGIEAATCAWEPLGWEAVAFAEVDRFPSAVLKHHYPSTPNLGDITKITESDIAGLGQIDLVVGGFPCQDLSIAGTRKGLRNEDGEITRSGLFFDAMRLVRYAREHCGCKWLLIENVPGLYSSNSGRDFASVVGEVVGSEFDVPRNGWRTAGVALGPGGLCEWVCLDAQWFGVPQRRRRVFAVGHFGDWAGRPPLFSEFQGMLGHPPPSRKAREELAGTIEASLGRSRGAGQSPGALCVDRAAFNQGENALYDPSFTEEQAASLVARGPHAVCSSIDASYGRLQGASGQDLNHGHSHLVAFGGNNTSGPIEVATAVKGDNNNQDFESETFIHIDGGDVARPLKAEHDGMPAADGKGYDVIAVHGTQDPDIEVEKTHPLGRNSGQENAIAVRTAQTGANGIGVAVEAAHTLDGAKGQAVAFQPRYARNGRGAPDTIAGPLTAEAGKTGKGDSAQCVAFAQNSRDELREMPVSGALAADPGMKQTSYIRNHMQVRRLTAIECERLQGFSDNYTQIEWRRKEAENCPDGPRYKALGNSMAVNVMAWLGKRIQEVDDLLNSE